MRVVAQVPGSQYRARAQFVREALLDERWADAVIAWIDLTGIGIDVFDHGPDLFIAEDVEAELSGLSLQFTPLFQDEPPAD